MQIQRFKRNQSTEYSQTKKLISLYSPQNHTRFSCENLTMKTGYSAELKKVKRFSLSQKKRSVNIKTSTSIRYPILSIPRQSSSTNPRSLFLSLSRTGMRAQSSHRTHKNFKKNPLKRTAPAAPTSALSSSSAARRRASATTRRRPTNRWLKCIIDVYTQYDRCIHTHTYSRYTYIQAVKKKKTTFAKSRVYI